jgi:SAM-dependent methyltransferase
MMMNPVVLRSADLIESKGGRKKGRVLDIGCGYGFFLQEMKSRGWQVEGVEVSGAGRDYIRGQGDIPVHAEPLEKLCLPTSSFDVVTLFYVIEHVLDPLSVLREVKRILMPGGLILLRWPHSTPIVKILGPLSKKVDLYHTPYHLYDFSPRTMEKMLLLCGYRGIQTLITGNTRPARRCNRWASLVFGQAGQGLCALTGGRLLLPGVSKTTLALS